MDSTKINSGDPRIDVAITSWLRYNPPESKDHEAISKLVASDDYATLKKLFSKRQEFGTAGTYYTNRPITPTKFSPPILFVPGIRGTMGPG
jgi:hypothetical protein